MGFLADTIIWDFNVAAARASGKDEGKGELILARLSQHKVKVQDLSFSPNGKYIVTLGGQDDNQLLPVISGLPVVGSKRASGLPVTGSKRAGARCRATSGSSS